MKKGTIEIREYVLHCECGGRSHIDAWDVQADPQRHLIAKCETCNEDVEAELVD